MGTCEEIVIIIDLYLIMSKEWNLTANKEVLSVKNPLRHLCERTIPEINKELKLKQNQDRPTEFVNLSIGDPVIYENFK